MFQIFLLPTNEVCKGYVFTGVCLSMGDVYLNACCNTPWQTPPSWADIPWVDTPQADTPLGRHCPTAQCMLGYIQQVGGTHPTGMYYFLNKNCRKCVIALVEVCNSSPCANGGSCMDINIDVFVCLCGDGFFRVMCDESKKIVNTLCYMSIFLRIYNCCKVLKF